MNKQDLIQKIKQLEGISQDERAYLIDLVNTKKKYGLVWEDKPEAVEEQLRENLPVLKEVKEKAIINGEEHPNHILIEGDNLHALTALTFTHEGKIDVIYIDPPYNTGNKDFRYNDTFKDEYIDKENPFRHSTWLSFMSRRLRIAKRLLSESGVIFISIDDNEMANLKLQCDEVFGESNYCGLITRKQSGGSKNDMGNSKIITTADYILPYKKNSFVFIPYQINNNKKFNFKDELGPYSIRALEMQGGDDTLAQRNKMGYSVYYNKDLKKIELHFDYDLNNNHVYDKENESLISKGYKCYRPRKRGREYGRWRWGAETFQEKFNNNLVHFDESRIYIKERETEFINKYPEAILLDYLNTQGTNELKELFDNKLFDFPKPTELIKFLIRVSSDKKSTILDFFAGSGTTLHATMALNAEDGGNRQCILVTNNENNICEEVTYERNKRVIQGYTNAKGVAVEGLKNNNLRYYKSEFVPSNKSESNKRLLTELSTDLLCIKEDCYTPFNHQETFTEKECKIFTNGKGKFMVVVYHSRNLTAVCEQLQSVIPSLPATEKVRLYVFSPEKETLLEEFQDIEEHIIAVPLPEAIYNAYRATFKTLKLDKKPLVVPTPEDESTSENDLFTNEEEA